MGKLLLRMPDDLHRSAQIAARQEDRSLNNWILQVVRAAINRNVRNMQVIELYREGLTFSQISKAVSLAPSYISQLIGPDEETREAVILRAGGKCERCGKVFRNSHIHHESRTAPDLNSMDNLKFLCARCHRKVHAKK